MIRIGSIIIRELSDLSDSPMLIRYPIDPFTVLSLDVSHYLAFQMIDVYSSYLKSEDFMGYHDRKKQNIDPYELSTTGTKLQITILTSGHTYIYI